MDSAKNAVKDFMSKSGHHDTTVHEKVAPAVTHETQHTHEHENVQTAIDKEVHQDHYHTSVQPISDKQTLPEKHHHNLGAVEHRQFEHGNDRDVEERLRLEQAKFKDETRKGETHHTTSAAPTIAGEHIHHHVHENIQPVVNRETIQPHVVHTTVPIHEVHHNAAQHHSTSALPAVSMADFKKQGGALTGREERYDGFEGEPRSMVGGSSTGTTGASTAGSGRGLESGATGSSTTGSGRGLDSDAIGSSTGSSGRGLGSGTSTGTGNTGNFGTMEDETANDSTTGTKPSLMQRILK